VYEAVQRIDGQLQRTEVKSRASKRPVPIPDRMVPIFEAWRSVCDDDYIFPGYAGGPCDPKRDWTMWSESLTRAGVAHVPLHGARGSAGSLLADMGVPDWRIAEILGHSSVTTTRRHYIQGTEDSHRLAIGNLLDNMLD
jgi:integrase